MRELRVLATMPEDSRYTYSPSNSPASAPNNGQPWRGRHELGPRAPSGVGQAYLSHTSSGSSPSYSAISFQKALSAAAARACRLRRGFRASNKI